MLNLASLGSLMERLYHDFVGVYYMMLPVCFALSLVITWLKSPQGSPEFIDTLKRVIVTTLILAAFPEISKMILFVADGIADKIDKTAGLDQIIEAAKLKMDDYGFSGKSLLLAFNNLIIAGLTFGSFLILYAARYLMIAIYHFYWLFYMVAAPLLLLFNVFAGTSHITKNLFKGMIEVASWKICWSILSAMLASLSLVDAYSIEGNYITLIVLNFVISIAMIFTPLFVKSIAEGGANSTAGVFGQAATAAMMATPAKAGAIAAKSKKAASVTKTWTAAQIQRFKPKPKESYWKY
jgi:hypothetical protein